MVTSTTTSDSISTPCPAGSTKTGLTAGWSTYPLAPGPRGTFCASAVASPLIQGLKTQLSTLQAQLAQVSSTLGPQHPKVLELQSQIAAARRSLDHEIQSYSQNNSSGIASAAQLDEKSRRAVEEQRTKLLKVRQLQDQGQKLQLELDSAQTVYKRALDGYDKVMFASSSLVSRAC